jgi:DNA-binding response OmpR family regulator
MARQRVLVIDDDPDTLALLSKKLFQAGYEVETCQEIESAFEEAVAFGPSLVIVDLLFPSGDAIPFLKRMKSSPTLERIPIIVLSAAEETESRERATECGAGAYLTKPIVVDDALAEITRQLARASHATYII